MEARGRGQGDKNDCFLVGPLLYLPGEQLLILQLYVGFLVNLFLSLSFNIRFSESL